MSLTGVTYAKTVAFRFFWEVVYLLYDECDFRNKSISMLSVGTAYAWEVLVNEYINTISSYSSKETEYVTRNSVIKITLTIHNINPSEVYDCNLFPWNEKRQQNEKIRKWTGYITRYKYSCIWNLLGSQVKSLQISGLGSLGKLMIWHKHFIYLSHTTQEKVNWKYGRMLSLKWENKDDCSHTSLW